MSPWLKTLEPLGPLLTGIKQTGPAMFLALAVALVVALLVFDPLAKQARCALHSFGRSFSVLLIAILTALGSGLVTAVYAGPALAKSGPIAAYLPWGAAVLALLAIALPLACWILKGKYHVLLGALAVSVAAGIGAAYLVGAAAGAVKSGGKSMIKTRDRTNQVDAELTR